MASAEILIKDVSKRSNGLGGSNDSVLPPAAEDNGLAHHAGAAFPDVLVSFRIRAEHISTFVIQNFREERIVLPAHFDHIGIGRRIDYESLVGRIGILDRIKRNPNLQTLLCGLWELGSPNCPC